MTTGYPMYTYTQSPASTYSPWERRRDALDRAIDFYRSEQGVIVAEILPEDIVKVADIFDAFIAPRILTEGKS